MTTGRHDAENPAWTGTVGAIAADLTALGDQHTPDAIDVGPQYLEVWSPIGELRIPRHHLPNHHVGDTITITIHGGTE